MANKVLMIEDSEKWRDLARQTAPNKVNAPDTLVEAQDALRNQSYEALLLDQALDEPLYNNKNYSGNRLIGELRSGVFGEINQSIPIYDISANQKLPGTVGGLSKPYTSEQLEEMLKQIDSRLTPQ